MIKIEVNNQLYKTETKNRNIKDLLIDIEKELIAQNEVISKLSIDGNEIELSVFPEGILWNNFNNVKYISIQSIKQSTAALNGLKEAIDISEILPKELEDITFALRMQTDKDIIDHLIYLIEKFIWLIRLIETAAAPLYLDYSESQVANYPLSELEDFFTEFMDRIFHAREENNDSKIADIIEMELIPITIELRDLLPKLREQGLNNLKQIN
ncbi:MAG: hypothetical protein JXA60_09885 [Candidatus Coatesbacteria bacterium]|nr:hypothetical protein [Candidatus Coatesbacteria bacterium]